MNAHISLFSALVTVVLGSAALVKSGTLRATATPALVSRYRAFIGVFTLWLLGRYVSIYASTNMSGLPKAYYAFMLIFDGSMDMAIVFAGFLVFTKLYALKRGRVLELAALIASLLSFALILADSLLQGLDPRTLRMTAAIFAGLGFYYIIFMAMIALGAAMFRKAPGAWGRSMAIGLLAMAVTGMAEGLWPLVGAKLSGRVPSEPALFLFTSIPWSAWCLYSVFILQRVIASAKNRNRDGLSLLSPSEISEFSGRYGFSARESEVLELLAQGLANAEIAEKLHLSLSTVKSHVHSILNKSGSRGRFSLLGKIRSKD